MNAYYFSYFLFPPVKDKYQFIYGEERQFELVFVFLKQ